MPALHEILRACRDQIRAAVYSLEPAAVDSMGQPWTAHDSDAGSIMGEGERVRLFDVFVGTASTEITQIGTTECDYRVPMAVVIIYGKSDNWNELAVSDGATLTHKLHNLDRSEVPGLQCYAGNASEITNGEDVKRLVVTFDAYVTATIGVDLGTYFYGEGGYGG